jgi:hypothetical protein
VLAETVPVTPKPASAEPSSFHNVSAFPMPIFCDPSLADPITSSGTKHPQQTPPRLVKLPDTPHIVISPNSTSGQPTPVSVPVSMSMLHNFSRRVSPSEGSSGPSDLFTPREGDPASVDTGDGFGTPSPSHADLPLPSSDDVMASVTSALEEESRSEIDTITIEVSDNVAVTESSPTGPFTDNEEDGGIELAEATQLDVSHLLPVDADAENEIDRPPTEPAAGHPSAAEVTTVVSLKSGEAQRADRSTLPTATDQTPPRNHDHPEEALTEVLPGEVLGLVDSPLLSPLSESFCEPGEDDSREDTVSKYGLCVMKHEHFSILNGITGNTSLMSRTQRTRVLTTSLNPGGLGMLKTKNLNRSLPSGRSCHRYKLPVVSLVQCQADTRNPKKITKQSGLCLVVARSGSSSTQTMVVVNMDQQALVLVPPPNSSNSLALMGHELLLSCPLHQVIPLQFNTPPFPRRSSMHMVPCSTAIDRINFYLLCQSRLTAPRCYPQSPPTILSAKKITFRFQLRHVFSRPTFSVLLRRQVHLSHALTVDSIKSVYLKRKVGQEYTSWYLVALLVTRS